MIQLELPLFEEIRTTADNPIPEQDRTHPAQMVIQHCGKARQHVSHARQGVGGWAGCPGTPDLRDAVTVTAGESVREDIRQMELRTYHRGGSGFHPPHTIDVVDCPGLTARQCGTADRHHHHRWWSIPDAFYWCNGVQAARPVEDVELP
jgi:hypothetical protein